MIELGLLVRLYLVNVGTGYFYDDFSLLVNVQSSVFDLFFRPLNCSQCCPPLYVIILKIFYQNFGANHQILGVGSLLGSSLALILMPIVTYKICKNKIAALIVVLIFAFNPHVLYFTQRLKQYSTDIFFTVFLIYIGYVFFQKPLTTKK